MFNEVLCGRFDGDWIECSIYKVPPFSHGSKVAVLVGGEQREVTFNQATDGEYWWTGEDGKELAPSHYTLWAKRFLPHNDRTQATAAAPVTPDETETRPAAAGRME